MKKRMLSILLAVAMVFSMFAFAALANDGTTTVTYDTSAQYEWSNYLNAMSVIPSPEYDTAHSTDNASLRDEPLYKLFKAELLVEGRVGANAAAMSTYTMVTADAGEYAGTLLSDFVQNVYGAFTYTLKGGREKGIALWNEKCSVPVTSNDAGYTYTNEDVQTTYTQDSYHNALKAFNAYMLYANDNQAFNVVDSGLYLGQKTRYEALVSALEALELATPAKTVTVGLGTHADYVFANGIAITISQPTSPEMGATITWDGGSVEVPATAMIFGGSHDSDEVIATTSVTMTGGTVRAIFGGGLHKSTVTQSNVAVSGGQVTNGVSGGGASSLIKDCGCENGNPWYNGDATQSPCKVDSATVTITGGDIFMVYGGGEGISCTGSTNVSIANASVDYVTAGGSNGYTGTASVVVNEGATIEVLQGANRGSMDSIGMEVNGGTINNMYIGGETGDSKVNGTYTSATVTITGGTVSTLAPGSNGTAGTNDIENATVTVAPDTVTNVAPGFEIDESGSLKPKDPAPAPSQLAAYEAILARVTLDKYKAKESYKALEAAIAQCHATLNTGTAMTNDEVDAICFPAEKEMRKDIPIGNGLKAVVDAEVFSVYQEVLFTEDSWSIMFDKYANGGDGWESVDAYKAHCTDAEGDAYVEQVKVWCGDLAYKEIPDGGVLDTTGYAEPYPTWTSRYNGIDVVKYLNDETVTNWRAAVRLAVEKVKSGEIQPADMGSVEVNGVNVDSYDTWKNTLPLPQQRGMTVCADAIWFDAANWPIEGTAPANGSYVAPENQVNYTVETYTAAWNQFLRCREGGQLAGKNDAKVSENMKELETLKTLMSKMQDAGSITTQDQEDAYKNLKTYMDIYNKRLNRVKLDENKAKEEYIAYKNLCDRANEIIANWDAWKEQGDKDLFPTADEMWGLISKDVMTDCQMETAWQAMRLVVGIDRGVKTVCEAKIAEWRESGMYTAESLAEVQTAYEQDVDSLAQDQTATDRDTQDFIAMLEELLVKVDPAPAPSQLAAYEAILARVTLDKYKAKESYKALEAAIAQCHATLNTGTAMTNDEVDAICFPAEKEMRKDIPIGNGLKAVVDAEVFSVYQEVLFTEDSWSIMFDKYANGGDGWESVDAYKAHCTDAEGDAYVEQVKVWCGDLAYKEIPDGGVLDTTGYAEPYPTWTSRYNGIDVVKYLNDETVTNWRAAVRLAVEKVKSGEIQPADMGSVEVNGVNVDSYDTWKNTLPLPQQRGMTVCADAIWFDAANWPIEGTAPANGSYVAPENQVNYTVETYTAAWNQFLRCREGGQLAGKNDAKVSENMKELETLKTLMSKMQDAGSITTQDQEDAYKNLKTYMDIYNKRLNRVKLDENKAKEEYIAYKNLCDRANEIIANWDAWKEQGDKDLFPTADEMWGLISKDVMTDCQMETAWQAMRLVVGIDRGVKTVCEAIIAEWKESGLYTDESLAAVQAAYEQDVDSLVQDQTAKDSDTQDFIAMLQELLVELPKPTVIGDLDGDGTATLAELIQIAKMIAEDADFTDKLAVCDANNDTKVSLADVILIAKTIAEA